MNIRKLPPVPPTRYRSLFKPIKDENLKQVEHIKMVVQNEDGLIGCIKSMFKKK